MKTLYIICRCGGAFLLDKFADHIEQCKSNKEFTNSGFSKDDGITNYVIGGFSI